MDDGGGGATTTAGAPGGDGAVLEEASDSDPPQLPTAVLDAAAFPRFEPLLLACQDYAVLSGCRFRLGYFSGLGTSEGAGGASASEREGAERWAAALLKAQPAVDDYVGRVQAGDRPLVEELERASRIVMAESVRNAMVAMLRKLDMWPPLVPPPEIEESDCSYEDTSAPLDVIAQRCYNDEARRQCSESLAGGLARRAATASFLVDFAHEVGAQLAPTPQTYTAMLEEFAERAEAWEVAHSSVGSTTPTSPEADPPSAPESAEEEVGGYELELEVLAASDLGAPEYRVGDLTARFTGSSSSSGANVYIEFELGSQKKHTCQCPASQEEPVYVDFAHERLVFQYHADPELVVRVRDRRRLQAVLRGDPLIGEACLPLGPELLDCQPRDILLPISRKGAHAGAVTLQYQLLPPASLRDAGAC